jgi:hypothetical protein
MSGRFWVYENWRARGHRASIHRAHCSHCNDGRGRSNGGYSRNNAAWHGPILSLDAAESYAARLGIHVNDVSHCSFCM